MKKICVVFLLTLIVGCSQSPGENNGAGGNEEINNEAFESDLSISFSEIEVIARDKSLFISGEAKTNANEFYYKLEQGDEVIIEETVMELDDSESEWQVFEINNDTLEVDEENEEAPYLTFYVKDEGHVVNPNYVPIDLLFY